MAITAAVDGTATQRFRARYGRALEWVVGALMVILALEVTVGVVFRGIGRSPKRSVGASPTAWIGASPAPM